MNAEIMMLLILRESKCDSQIGRHLSQNCDADQKIFLIAKGNDGMEIAPSKIKTKFKLFSLL